MKNLPQAGKNFGRLVIHGRILFVGVEKSKKIALCIDRQRGKAFVRVSTNGKESIGR
jgi:hypothetical protein